MMEKTVSDAINFRRSIRVYKDLKIESSKVVNCLKNASIAATSSNLQLWEFYHVTSQKKMDEVSVACFSQSAAKTAQQFVVFVSRKDLWKKRSLANIEFVNKSFDKPNLDAQFELHQMQ